MENIKEYTDETNDMISEESLTDIEYSSEKTSEEVINDMSDDNEIICNDISYRKTCFLTCARIGAQGRWR